MKEITVSSRKLEIREKLKKKKEYAFLICFQYYQQSIWWQRFSNLEMARNQELIIQQDRLFAEIFCEVN